MAGALYNTNNNLNRPMRVVGLISGTSADGADVAVVEIEGAPPSITVKLIRHETVRYDPSLQAEIFDCFRPATGTVDRLSRLNFALGEAYAAAVLTVIQGAGLSADDIDLVASHGQTLWYDAPENGHLGNVMTLGEGAVIAERTGITTITNIRSRDLAAGGRGAPLVSYLDWLLFRDPTRWRAIQNIGGIGNVTILPPLDSTEPPLSFDTGPGNMIMDCCAAYATNGAQTYDRDGLIAAHGQVSQSLLAELMGNPYIRQTPPKTTGRELFGVQFGREVWERGQALSLSAEDIVATVTAFTAESIADAIKRWSAQPISELYIAGGGALNPTLLAMLRARIGSTQLHAHEELGIAPAAKEAILFALLGYETWHRRPGSLPVFTGASHAPILGSITPGRLW